MVATSLVLSLGLVSLGSGASAEVRAGGARVAPGRLTAQIVAGPHAVSTPAWWRGGACDPKNAPSSHPLVASWDGLVACGPGPTQGGDDHLVDYFPGAWGEFEWECVELSMRWMYLAWGVNPYPANGWDVVRDYGVYKQTYNPDGPDLIVVNNGTVGTVPQPGDVVSLGPTQYDVFGHTAVVTATSVSEQGNGTITLIQQNGGPGNDGWVTYPVNDWVVGDDVTAWLHNPSWNHQWPVVEFTRAAGFEARVAAPGNPFGPVANGARSIAVAGGTGTNGTNGRAIYGYIAQDGDFFVRPASSATWSLAAHHAKSMALAITASGAPVLAYLSTTGGFFAETGSLTGGFRLEAGGAASIALADSGAATAPLLGYVRQKSGAFLVKAGTSGEHWTIAQPSGVRAIALAEGPTASSYLMGFVSADGGFWAKQGKLNGTWMHEANHVTAISLAVLGPSGTPLLGYLAGRRFYVAEGIEPSTWAAQASNASAIAVAAGAASGASQILGYVTDAGNLEVMQGSLGGRFSTQATEVTSLAVSSVTDS